MKKNIYSMLLAISVVLVWSSCEKELMDYEGVDGIYFDVQYGAAHGSEALWAHQNYTHVSFGDIIDTETEVRMKVGICGAVKDYDRPFQVVIVNDSTNAVAEEYSDFSDTQVIKAGENQTIVTLKVYKTERMATDTVQIQLRILPGEHFEAPFVEFGQVPGRWNDTEVAYSRNSDPLIHNIFIDNILSRPTGWFVGFGTFTPTKYQYLMDVSGYNVNHFNEQMVMLSGRGAKIVEKAKKDLNSRYSSAIYYLKKGDISGLDYFVLDEGGTIMWVDGINDWNETTRPEDIAKQYITESNKQE